jgi:hypothetical protein
MAVAAWADWHEPADPAIATSSHRRSAALQRAAAAGRVHVLNAARTSSAALNAHPTARTVAAHIRRGHWRRQPVGVGRAQIRMVRVSPAIIGAGNLPKTAPVYRLPATRHHAEPVVKVALEQRWWTGARPDISGEPLKHPGFGAHRARRYSRESLRCHQRSKGSVC